MTRASPARTLPASDTSPPEDTSIVTVGLISDDNLYREGLTRLLAADPSIEVAGADGLPAAVRRRNGPPSTAFVLLVDGRMAGGLDAAIEAVRANQGARVVLLGADELSAGRALAGGVRGLLDRNTRPEDLLKAIRVVSQGQLWARRQTMEDYIQAGMHSGGRPPARGGDGRLSERERSVFRHAARGLSNKEIAERMEISAATVKAHLTSIFRKLDVHSRAELAAAYHHVGE